MKPLAPFYSSCVDWDPNVGAALMYLVDRGVECSRDTVRRNAAVHSNPLPDPKMNRWGVSFYRLPGWDVYWYTHSAIEYVYAKPETIKRLHDHAVASGVDGFAG